MVEHMELVGLIERATRVHTTRHDPASTPADARCALVALTELEAWLESSKARLATMVAAGSSFPEKAIADDTRSTLGAAANTLERAATLDAAPTLAGMLDEAAITAAHVDVVTRNTKDLDDRQRRELIDRCDQLASVAATATPAEFARTIRLERNRILADDGMDRLQRQRRDTSLRSWVDNEGMYHLHGRFDPVTGVRLAARLESAVETLFAEQTPDTSPTDPVLRQHHLRALALDRLLTDGGEQTGGVTGRRGRPEFVAVINVDQPNGAGGPVIDWAIPVEIPQRVLAELVSAADVHAVVVRNGVVIHAPGALDLGRTTRLANQAQRRALRGLYATCAIAGCSTHYDRCKLHHIIWWRNGGNTDLDNLLPLCSHHHHKVHDASWQLQLDSHRQLTITYPDGTVRNTGPPTRNVA
jgi:hypothetical protein